MLPIRVCEINIGRSRIYKSLFTGPSEYWAKYFIIGICIQCASSKYFGTRVVFARPLSLFVRDERFSVADGKEERKKKQRTRRFLEYSTSAFCMFEDTPQDVAADLSRKIEFIALCSLLFRGPRLLLRRRSRVLLHFSSRTRVLPRIRFLRQYAVEGGNSSRLSTPENIHIGFRSRKYTPAAPYRRQRGVMTL